MNFIVTEYTEYTHTHTHTHQVNTQLVDQVWAYPKKRILTGLAYEALVGITQGDRHEQHRDRPTNNRERDK